jgi:hypothetical protein
MPYVSALTTRWQNYSPLQIGASILEVMRSILRLLVEKSECYVLAGWNSVEDCVRE